MSNSPLVKYTAISPNRTSPRKDSIDRITIHCVVGQVTMKRLGDIFAPRTRGASSNYGVCTDGIAMFCEEKDRSWCSSTGNAKGSNDHRAVTIEVASDTKSPYAVKPEVYNMLIDLCVDICKRNGKTKLLWLGYKEKALAYNPKSNEMVMTAHRWFANTDCPGDYLYFSFGDIAEKVTNALAQESPAEKEIEAGDFILTEKDLKGYKSAALAIAQGPSSITYCKGHYYVYKIYVDSKNNISYNISRKKGCAGAWVVL